jgi:hypothetical protein
MPKALTYFVALRGMGASLMNVVLRWHHEEHERPEFIPYPISASGPSLFPGEMVTIHCSVTIM